MIVTGIEAARPVFATSALVELGCALHVLNEPAHHDAAQWAAQVRTTLSPSGEAELAQWSWLTQAIRAAPFVTPDPSEGAADDDVRRLRSADPYEVARGLIRPISPRGDVAVARRWARSRGPAVADCVDSLVRDPMSAVGEFASFVESCFDGWFGREWQRVRPRLAASARRFSHLTDRLGAAEAMTGLAPAIRLSGGDTLSIAKVQNRRYALDDRGVICVPSAFIDPHLYLADAPGRPLVVIYAAEAGRRESAPTVKELTRRLDATSSAGRLEVARAIATEPRTAGEIAELWNMDATLVTRHLRTLAAAGLATTTRRGRFVQYALDRVAVARLGDDLLALLLR